MTFPKKPDKFLSVVEAHKGIIYKVANSYCKRIEDRKDLVQEIILQLWKSFDRYDEQYKLTTWIYRIALNVAISFYRKETVRKEISNPLSGELFSIADATGNSQMAEDTLFLHQFIAELKDFDKALMLLYLEEKSHKEIAEIIGITETNVSTKVNRIKKILKQRFSQITM